MKINAQLSKDFDGDLLVIPFYKPAETSNGANAARDALRDSIPSGLSVEVTSVVADVINEGLFKADVLAVQVTRNAGSTNPRYIALLGLGPDPKVGVPSDVEVSSALRMGRTLSSLAKEYASKKVAIVAPPGLSNAGVTQLVLGLHDGAYKDTRFQKKPEPGLRSIDLTILGAADHVVDKIKLTHSLTEKIASGVHFAKDLVGAPANMKTPVVVAEQAQKIARENDLQCTILGEAECRARGMGGYLGVQQGEL